MWKIYIFIFKSAVHKSIFKLYYHGFISYTKVRWVLGIRCMHFSLFCRTILSLFLFLPSFCPNKSVLRLWLVENTCSFEKCSIISVFSFIMTNGCWHPLYRSYSCNFHERCYGNTLSWQHCWPLCKNTFRSNRQSKHLSVHFHCSINVCWCFICSKYCIQLYATCKDHKSYSQFRQLRNRNERLMKEYHEFDVQFPAFVLVSDQDIFHELLALITLRA